MSLRGKSICIGSLGFIVFALLRNFIPLENKGFFILACVIFVAVALVSYYIAERVKLEYHPKNGGILWSILPIIALVVWMILFYINETNTEYALDSEELIRKTFPFPLWILLMLAGTGLCIFLLGREHKEKGTEKKCLLKKVLRVVIAVLFTIGIAVQFYAPNIFLDIQGGTFHSHAYTNSIINVCWLTPYSENMESMYGHYAILYMPFVKALHRFFRIDYLTGIFIVTATVAGLSILLFAYVINYFAHSEVIYYLSLFAIGEEYFMLMQGGVYMQLHPHRMIFPVAVAALALLEHKRQRNYPVCSVILLTLSMIWSTEVGLVTMLSYAVFSWCRRVMDGEKLSFRKIMLLFRELLVYSILPFVLAYGVVNGYNLFAGGNVLRIDEFLYPLISDRGYVDSVQLPLPDVTHAWVGASIIFLIFVTIALFQLLFPQVDEEQGKKSYFLLIGIMSLGLMIYYINRATEGSMFIVMFLMLILQAVILQKCQDIFLEWKTQEKESSIKQLFFPWSLRLITTFILFIMAFDSLYSMPSAWKKSSETIWKRDELLEFAQDVWLEIPPDAKSFGEGVPELLSMVDRDTHLHTTEWSYTNTPPETMKYVWNELADEQWFFCNSQSLYYLQCEFPGLTDHFFQHKIMEYNGVEFYFFTRID